MRGRKSDIEMMKLINSATSCVRRTHLVFINLIIIFTEIKLPAPRPRSSPSLPPSLPLQPRQSEVFSGLKITVM